MFLVESLKFQNSRYSFYFLHQSGGDQFTERKFQKSPMFSVSWNFPALEETKTELNTDLTTYCVN